MISVKLDYYLSSFQVRILYKHSSPQINASLRISSNYEESNEYLAGKPHNSYYLRIGLRE